MQSSLLSGMMIQTRPIRWEGLRQQAEQALKSQTWPHALQRYWNDVDLESLKKTIGNSGPRVTINTDRISIPETAGSKLVFVNGILDPDLSNTSNLPPGVQLLNLASSDDMVHELGSISNQIDTNLLTNINTSRFLDGLLLIVSENTQVELPLRVSFINSQIDSDQITVSLPRLFIVIKSGSSATLLEDYQGYGRYLTSSVAEVTIGRNAKLNHERIQQESLDALHFSQLAIRVEHNGYYNCRTVSSGGHSSCAIQSLAMIEQGAKVTLDELAILNNGQTSNTQTTIDHKSSNCTSKQTYRAIADSASSATFDGTIHVHRNTQDTIAQQQCRGLLLDTESQISVKPQLKIYTDDVKCSHEAAIGQLDSNMLFYLQSRGINPTLARNILTCAFASYLLTDISIPSLKQQLYKLIIDMTSTGSIETSK